MKPCFDDWSDEHFFSVIVYVRMDYIPKNSAQDSEHERIKRQTLGFFFLHWKDKKKKGSYLSLQLYYNY